MFIVAACSGIMGPQLMDATTGGAADQPTSGELSVQVPCSAGTRRGQAKPATDQPTKAEFNWYSYYLILILSHTIPYYLIVILNWIDSDDNVHFVLKLIVRPRSNKRCWPWRQSLLGAVQLRENNVTALWSLACHPTVVLGCTSRYWYDWNWLGGFVMRPTQGVSIRLCMAPKQPGFGIDLLWFAEASWACHHARTALKCCHRS